MKLKNMNLKTKLTLSVTTVSFIPLILLVFYSYYHVANFTEKKYITGTSASLFQMKQRVDNYFTVLDQNSIRFFSDMFYKSDIQDVRAETQEFYRFTLYNLFNYYSNRSETHSVLFYSPVEDEVYVVNDTINSSFRGKGDITSREWYKSLLVSQERRIIEPLHQIETYPSEFHLDRDKQVLSFNRVMYDRSKVYGILSANYRPDYLEQLFQEIISDENESVFFTNMKGELLASASQSNSFVEELDSEVFEQIMNAGQLSGHFRYNSIHKNTETLIVYIMSDEWKTILYKEVPVQAILKEVAQNRNTMLLLSTILILLLIATTAALSINFTKPLLVLKRHMLKLEKGDFTSEIKIHTNDEIGVISATFNQMTQKINEMINEQYKSELILKTAQLKTLQAQINPHFLNNTLLAIGSVAMSKGVDEIEKMSLALSSMLRYSITAQENDVPLQKEIENVIQYLSIQKFRFEERLEYELNVDEQFMDFLVPKLILQPIVENAIIHGIEESIESGIVIVNVYADDRACLNISIKNTFKCIAQDKLLELRRKISQANSHDVLNLQHHGILNVYHRLKLAFGNKFELQIDSDPKSGTEIVLLIPIKGGV